MASQALTGDPRSRAHPNFAPLVTKDRHTSCHPSQLYRVSTTKPNCLCKGGWGEASSCYLVPRGTPALVLLPAHRHCSEDTGAPLPLGRVDWAGMKLGWGCRVGQGVGWESPHIVRGFPLSPHKQLHKVRNWHEATEGAEAEGWSSETSIKVTQSFCNRARTRSIFCWHLLHCWFPLDYGKRTGT